MNGEIVDARYNAMNQIQKKELSMNIDHCRSIYHFE